MCLLTYFSVKYASVKHVTWILLEISCNSCHKSMAGWSKLTSNSMTIPCYLSRFYSFSICPNMTWILQKLKSWNFHGRENDPLNFIGISHFQPNCHQKDIRNTVSHFLQGWYDLFLHCQSPLSNGI